MPYTEIGWQPLEQRADAQGSPWTAHLPAEFPVYQWHSDTFDLPEGARVGIFIGPEGGFEGSEIEKALESGAKVITLGKRILRTETAGPALIAVLTFMHG